MPQLTVIRDHQPDLWRLIVPVGLSYLTFRLIHYAVEAREQHLPDHSFSEFMANVSFLPIFTAGPIERFDRLLANRRHTLSMGDVVEGAHRVIIAMIKAFALPAIIMSAMPFENIAAAADSLVAEPDSVTLAAVWGTLYITTLYYYFNFAGYSDIAVGSARFLGFGIMENFNHPFLSTSISEFWRRWHISLGEWCRSYVFFPISRVLRSATLGSLAAFVAIRL